MATVRGGDQYEKVLRDIVNLLRDAGGVRVGFLEGATYPDGKPVAMIAAIQEYGAPRAHIPARPFFRNMIAAKSGEWPEAIAKLLKAHDWDAHTVLSITGQAIAGQLRQSIIDTNAPPLSPRTIRRKGFSKPLIETGVMINSIDSEVF